MAQVTPITKIIRTYSLLQLLLLAAYAQPLEKLGSSKLMATPNEDPLETAASDFSYEYSPNSYNPNSALPMIHSDKFNLIMPDYYDHHPAESVQYQNFEQFYDPQMTGNMEYKMEESQFVHDTAVRAPQPLSAEEKRIRLKLEPVDERKEKKALRKLKKGTTKPRGDAYPQWEQFDYDLYSTKPGDKKKHTQG